MKIHMILAMLISLLFAQASSAKVQYQYTEHKIGLGFLFQVPDYLDMPALNGTQLGYNIPGFSGNSAQVYDFGYGNTTLVVSYAIDRYHMSAVSSVFSTADFSTPGTYTSFDGWATLQVSVVPEPAVWATMLGGFGVLGAALRRRRQRPTPLLA